MNNHLTKLQSLLPKYSLDAVFVSAVPNITYLTGFAGFSTEDRDAFLFITQKEQYVLTHGIYKEAAEKYLKDFTLVEIRRENPISQAVKNLVKKHGVKQIGFEAYDLTVEEYQNLVKQVPEKVLKKTDILHLLRELKTVEEIHAIKHACKLGDKTFRYIIKKIKENISEKELAFALDVYVKQLGVDISFPTIIAFGSNASFPHHRPSDRKLKKNTFALLDFGVKANNYCSDMTRTISFGKVSKDQKKIYQTVLEAQQKAIEYIENKLKSGEKIMLAEIDKAARDHIVSQRFPQFPHSLGHGIGIEVHELPRLHGKANAALQPGTVFSIEPGIYLPDQVGVRIEDLFTIENNKLIQLTTSPKNLIEL